MVTKKQKAELEKALGTWIFDSIWSDWSTKEILSAVAKDWRTVVGTSNLRGLPEWSADVLELCGLGVRWEVRQRAILDAAEIVRKRLVEDGSGGGMTVHSLRALSVAEEMESYASVGRRLLSGNVLP